MPPKTRWWPRHWLAVSNYVSLSSKSAAEAGAGRQVLMDGIREWEKSIEGIGPTDLISRHIAMEAALIEAAIHNDSTEITRLGENLYLNAEALARMQSERFDGLPEYRLKHLLEEHIISIADMVRFRMKDDAAGRDNAVENGRGNAIALANFTTEWL